MYDEMLSDYGVSCFQNKTTAKEHGKVKGEHCKNKCVFFLGKRRCGEHPVNPHTRYRVGGFFPVSCCLSDTSKFVVSCFHHVVVRWYQHSRSADLEPTRAKFGSGNECLPVRVERRLCSALLKMRGCRDQRTVHNMRNRAPLPLASVPLPSSFPH